MTLLVEGFFPRVPLDAKPAAAGSGFQEFGLPLRAGPGGDPLPGRVPYRPPARGHWTRTATPPARSRSGPAGHRALQRRAIRVARAAAAAVGRVAGLVRAARAEWEPVVLDNERLDLAVARGAAYYGMVRRGQGVRIAAGLARTYYIGVDDTRQEASRRARSEPPGLSRRLGGAVCLVPAGVEPGHDVDLTQRQFDLLVSEPVEFPLYVSSTRLTDRPGELVPLDREQITPLPPIRTVLRTRKKGEAETISVNLHARLTEIGTLDLWCSEVEGRRSWRLQFDVRSATQTDLAAHETAAEGEGFVDEAIWQRVPRGNRGHLRPRGPRQAGRACQAACRGGGHRPQRLAHLAVPPDLGGARWKSRPAAAAARSTRPAGSTCSASPCGPATGWRWTTGAWPRPGGSCRASWSIPTAACRMEGWILWRRIAGGLAAGQQQALADPLIGPIRGLHRQLMTGKGRGGDFSFPPMRRPKFGGSWARWSCCRRRENRVGRHPLGPIAEAEDGAGAAGHGLGARPARRPRPALRPAERGRACRRGRRVARCGCWTASPGDPAGLLAVMQLARRTEDRYRDLPEKSRTAAARWLQRQGPAHFVELVLRGGRLDSEEQGMVFGESLPKGLRLG